jgi:hypothetical protein
VSLSSTPLTELLGIAHPILCRGLRPGVPDARYVAAVDRTGDPSKGMLHFAPADDGSLTT